MKKNQMKIGDRAKLIRLPVGSGLSNKLVGRVGMITFTVNYDPGGRFHTIRLKPLPRERKEKVVGGVHEDYLEKL